MKKILFNKALRILLLTNGLILVAGAMIGPIYALFVDKVGGDLLDASITAGVFAFAAGITTYIVGRYVDKIKEDELIVAFGYLVLGVGFLMYMLVDSILTLLVVQIVVGFAEAVYAPAFDALYSKHLCETKSGREWGTWEAMNYFTTAVGAVIGGFIVTIYGFNVIFVIMAILCLVSAVYIYNLPRKVL